MKLDPQAELLKQRIRKKVAGLSRDSIELAWVLGEVFAEKYYRSMGYETFHRYLAEELCNPTDPERHLLSRAWAYRLASAGARLMGARKELEPLIAAGTMGLARFLLTAQAVDRGCTVKEAVAASVETADVTALADAVATPDPESYVRFTVAVPRGDLAAMRLGLLKFALANGHRSINEAVIGVGLYYHDFDDIYEQLPHLVPWREQIEAGEFFCRLCGAIPMQPTPHHVLLQSLGGAKGPTVVLCWEPCHKDVVQPRWRQYAAAWGFDLRGIAEDIGGKAEQTRGEREKEAS